MGARLQNIGRACPLNWIPPPSGGAGRKGGSPKFGNATPFASCPAPIGSASRSISTVSAHSNSDAVAGFGLRLRPLGFIGSSAMNSAHENSVG